MTPFTQTQLTQILESLRWTRERFMSYSGYPDEAFRQMQVAEVDETIRAVKKAKAAT